MVASALAVAGAVLSHTRGMNKQTPATARVNARHHYTSCATGCTHGGAPPLGPPLDDSGPDTIEPGDAWPDAPLDSDADRIE